MIPHMSSTALPLVIECAVNASHCNIKKKGLFLNDIQKCEKMKDISSFDLRIYFFFHAHVEGRWRERKRFDKLLTLQI